MKVLHPDEKACGMGLSSIFNLSEENRTIAANSAISSGAVLDDKASREYFFGSVSLETGVFNKHASGLQLKSKALTNACRLRR